MVRWMRPTQRQRVEETVMYLAGSIAVAVTFAPGI